MVIAAGGALIGANYGANLSLFPSYTKDLWGLKTFGMNYGVLFTAWGVGGLVAAASPADAHRQERRQLHLGSVSGRALLVGAALTLLLKPKSANPATLPV